MTNEELIKLIEDYPHYTIHLHKRVHLSDDELKDMQYPYPIETIDTSIHDTLYPHSDITHIDNIPMEDIELCDIGHSDKVISLETYLN